MSSMREVVVVASSLIVLHACGDSSNGARAREPLPADCAAGWQPVTPAEEFDITSGLVCGDGTLYYGSFGAQAIRAVPVSGGEPRIVAPVYPTVLWLEGDQLVLNGGDLGNQFFSVPSTGGAPALVYDGTAGRTEVGIAQIPSHLLTTTDFFWTESDRAIWSGPTTVWRGPRSGGPPVEIARFALTPIDGIPSDRAPYFQGAALAPDGLVLAESWGVGWFVPLDGAPPRMLAMPRSTIQVDIEYLGQDATGVYWSVPNPEVPSPSFENQIVRAPTDGGPLQPFWSPLPPDSNARQLWPDGQGGWIIAGYQAYAGERGSRATIWAMDPEGNRRLLACSSESDFLAPYIDEPPAITPDAIYFFAHQDSQIQIVRVPRL